MTLIETLLVVSISALIMVPILGWGLLAMRQQVDVQDRNTDGASIGLLRTYFVRDVASAATAEVDGAAAGSDCSGGDGAATQPDRTVLRLAGSGGEWLVYNVAPSSIGDGLSIWRRECGPSGVGATAEMVQRVSEGTVEVGCTARPDAGPGDCGRVNLRLITEDLETVAMTASIRAGTAVAGPDAPEFVSPEVVITVDPTTVHRGDAVTFDASGSVDPRGGELDFLWEFGDGDTSTDPVVTRAYSELGEFTAVLTATNSDGTPTSDFVRIEVENRTPTAVISAPEDGLDTHRCTPVSFAAEGSNDSGDADHGGQVTTYTWSYGDGASATRSSAVAHTHEYAELSPDDGDDPFQVSLLVADNDGGESQMVTRSVHVRNRPPDVPTITANGLGGQIAGALPLTVQFDSSASDPDGDCDTLSYDWEFGDGATSTEANPTHTYTSGTEHTARLTVTDDAGEQRSSNDVTIRLNTVPIAQFTGADSVRTGADYTVTNHSWDAETANGDLVYQWTFPQGSPGTSADRTPGPVRFTHDVGGGDTFISAQYTIDLAVTDADGAIDTASRTITVNGAPAPGGLGHSGSSVCLDDHWLWGCREWRHTNTISWNPVAAVDRYQVHLRWRNCFIFCGSWQDRYLETGSSPLTLVNHEREDGDVTMRVRARDAYTGKWGAWSGSITEDFAG